VQIVTNHQDIQQYAANTVFQAVSAPNCHETAVKVGGYILGEFGHLIAENTTSSPQAQFQALHSKWGTCSLPTRALLLSTYVKFVNLYPEMTETVRAVFKNNDSSLDAEIQQRAYEYLKLTVGSEELLQTVWDVMPAFPDRVMNLLGGGDKEGASPSPDVNADKTKGERGLRDSKEPGSAQGTPTASRTPVKAAYDPMKELEDIFGGSNAVGSSVGGAPVATPATGTMGGIDDLLGGGLGVMATPASSQLPGFGAQGFGGAQGLDLFNSVQSGPPTKLPKKIALSTEGVLYQDGNIQIGFKSEFSNGTGKMMLYYGNVSPHQLEKFGASVHSAPSVHIQAQSVPEFIAPRTQAQQMLTITCTGEFNDPPTLDLRFLAGGVPQRLSLRLPIIVCRFIEPLKMQGPEFFNQWKVVEQPPLAEQIIVKAGSVGFADTLALSKLFSTGFRFAVLQGVDPNANNLVAAGTFRSTTMQTVCLIRIETNPGHQMYRVTVKSQSPQVTAALKDLIQDQLGE